MGYTINKIQEEMTAAGSHWWDRGTMRFFKCRVGDQVYEGEGGIYFVTSEKGPRDDSPRLYTVRQYDPATKEVSTVGEFNSMSRAVAHRLAAKSAGPAATVTKEVYREPSAAEQLALDIRRGGGGGNEHTAARLIRLATNHHKMMEDYCSIPDADVYDDDEEPTPRHARLVAEIEDAAKQIGCGVILSGDPRGATVKLILPNKATNSMGGEGWCVPTA